MRSQAEYTIEFLDKLEAEMLALPPPDRSQQKVNKQEAVSKLSDAIAQLQERGFSLEQIAESLSGRGLELTTPTLKTYLQRVRPKNGKSGTRTSRKGKAAAPTATETARDPSHDGGKNKPAEDAAAHKKEGKGAFMAKDKNEY